MTGDKLSASVVLQFMPYAMLIPGSNIRCILQKKETLTSIHPYIVIHFCLSLHHKDAHTSSKESKYLSAIKAWVERSGIPE